MHRDRMHTVSIVIPTYNAARYLRQAIDSALAQTHGDKEIIVVDDGSTDDTSEILAAYAGRIRVLSQRNQGAAAACNAGAEAARGRWIALLDADDEWLPEKLAQQLRRCGQYVISHTDSVCFGTGIEGEIRRSSFEPPYHGQVLEHLLIRNFITKSSVLMLRETYLELGGFPRTSGAVEDWPFWLTVCAAHELGYVPEPLVRYRVHGQSQSMKARATHAAHLRIINDAFGAGGVGRNLPRLRARALASSCQINSHYAAQSGDWTFAVRCALNALRYEPANVRTWKNLIKSALIPLGVRY